MRAGGTLREPVASLRRPVGTKLIGLSIHSRHAIVEFKLRGPAHCAVPRGAGDPRAGAQGTGGRPCQGGRQEGRAGPGQQR